MGFGLLRALVGRGVVATGVLICCGLVGCTQAHAVPGLAGSYDWRQSQTLAEGVRHAAVVVDSPESLQVHCLQVDTTVSGIGFNTTPRCDRWVQDSAETRRQTTRRFIASSVATGTDMVCAINADGFFPWPAPWKRESLTNLGGLAVSNGDIVSPPSGSPSFIVGWDQRVRLEATPIGYDTADVHTAVSGSEFCLQDGEPTSAAGDHHPRTGIGISRDGRQVYLITIDGRRRDSVGATVGEVGEWLAHFGSFTGINLDGGGSTTMAWWNPAASGKDKSVLLNTPVGSGTDWLRLPAWYERLVFRPTERCVGNSLGVYVVPKAEGPGQ